MNVGGVWSKSATTTTAVPTFADPAFLASPAFATFVARAATGETPAGNRSGLIGGAQIGYNVQFNSVVVGFEADLQGISNSRATSTAVSTSSLTSTFNGSNLITTITTSRSLDYLGTVRGRVGFVVDPSLLLYWTGGLAYGGTKSSTSIAYLRDTGFQTPGFSSGEFSGMRVGYALGGGAEWMSGNHWSLKAEYLYYDLSAKYALSPLSSSLFATGNLYTTVATTASTRFNGHIARAGINYHF